MTLLGAMKRLGAGLALTGCCFGQPLLPQNPSSGGGWVGTAGGGAIPTFTPAGAFSGGTVGNSASLTSPTFSVVAGFQYFLQYTVAGVGGGGVLTATTSGLSGFNPTGLVANGTYSTFYSATVSGLTQLVFTGTQFMGASFSLSQISITQTVPEVNAVASVLPLGLLGLCLFALVDRRRAVNPSLN